MKHDLALIDLDSMLHLVAYHQWKAGNRTNDLKVIQHVKQFYNTIKKSSDSSYVIPLYQDIGHKNFRNFITDRYKEHRTTLEWVDHWKPVIIKAFKDIGGYGLKYIETDDAQSILARKIQGSTVIVSGDKDMLQVPGTHYNPYKPKLDFKDRWKYISPRQAEYELYSQVITGDSTDVSKEICGIMGIGSVKACKALDRAPVIDNVPDYFYVVKEMYTKKYASEGFKRANLTYKMVRLLTGEPDKDSYASKEALEEVKTLLENYEDYKIKVINDIDVLFDPISPKNLFNA